MSALLEQTVYFLKAKIEKGTCSFFKSHAGFNDMNQTHMVRVRMRAWTEVMNCIRHHCTLDWYLDRNILDEDNTSTLKQDEYLILRISSRSTPPASVFNKEFFIDSLNKQYQRSKIINEIKSHYTK